MAGHVVYIKEKKTVAGKKGVQWPEKKKLQAVTTYVSCGSPTMTAAMTGVPVKTLENWMRQPWWKEYIQEIHYQDDIKLDDKLSKVLEKSMDAVLDRIENGDTVYDPRTGKIVRVPAKLRDVQKVSSDTIDKKQLLRKINNKQSPVETVTADHLVQLAQAFAQMATGQKPHPKEVMNEIIDGEAQEILDVLYTEEPDAIHEEREEGL